MHVPTPVNTWSPFLHDAIAACPRQAYYQSWGSWGGWSPRAPAPVRRAWLEKRIESDAAFLTRLLHRQIVYALDPLQEGDPHVPLPLVCAQAAQDAEEAFTYLRERQWETRNAPFTPLWIRADSLEPTPDVPPLDAPDLHARLREALVQTWMDPTLGIRALRPVLTYDPIRVEFFAWRTLILDAPPPLRLRVPRGPETSEAPLFHPVTGLPLNPAADAHVYRPTVGLSPSPLDLGVVALLHAEAHPTSPLPDQVVWDVTEPDRARVISHTPDQVPVLADLLLADHAWMTIRDEAGHAQDLASFPAHRDPLRCSRCPHRLTCERTSP